MELTLPSLVVPAAGLTLRPWRPDDAPALVAAWGDPDIAAETVVPKVADRDEAVRWIAAAPTRAAAGVAVDVAVERHGAVVGEVGLARLTLRVADGAGRRVEWEIGWWLLPPARGAGVATAAADRLAGWAVAQPGIERVVARIRSGHGASEAVARRIGLRRVGAAGPDRDLWVGPPSGCSGAG